MFLTLVISLPFIIIGIFNYEKYLNEYKPVKKLGKGGFGEVYLGRHFLTGEEYAIKKIQFKNKLPADKIEELLREE